MLQINQYWLLLLFLACWPAYFGFYAIFHKTPHSCLHLLDNFSQANEFKRNGGVRLVTRKCRNDTVEMRKCEWHASEWVYILNSSVAAHNCFVRKILEMDSLEQTQTVRLVHGCFILKNQKWIDCSADWNSLRFFENWCCKKNISQGLEFQNTYHKGI